jgi:hypothetical protein
VLFQRSKAALKRMPKPLYGLVIYVVAYFTTLRHLAELAITVAKLPESWLILLRTAFLIAGLSHFVLTLSASLLQRWYGQRRLWFRIERFERSLTLAFIIGAIVTVPRAFTQGPVRVVDDKARIAIADKIVDSFERLTKVGFELAASNAKTRLDDRQQDLESAWQDGRDLIEVFRQLQAKRRVQLSDNQSGYGYLIVYAPSKKISPSQPLLTAPDFPLADYSRDLAKEAQAGAQSWMTWSPVGHLAVAAHRDDDIGMLISATLWDERSFLESTRALWEQAGYGLYLVREGNFITYSTEISDFGERMAGRLGEPVKPGHINEIVHRGHVEYVYQRQPREKALFPGLFFRIRFPATPPVSVGKKVKAVISLVISLFLVAFVVWIEAGEDGSSVNATSARVPSSEAPADAKQ